MKQSDNMISLFFFDSCFVHIMLLFCGIRLSNSQLIIVNQNIGVSGVVGTIIGIEKTVALEC